MTTSTPPHPITPNTATHAALSGEGIAVFGMPIAVARCTLSPEQGAVQPPVPEVTQLAREARVPWRTLAALYRGGAFGTDRALRGDLQHKVVQSGNSREMVER